ncbi:SDR family oxidoreductase [Metallibacterium sp.]|uniref:SDR family oxidoreductase n=1 Tax=Metallibacterium sp. TaxID=2940281 RepID=UPI002633644A|nr:SDR family oxidoreductase [Metallibacterium sp.]
MRSALITGANRGLGLEFTTQLLDAGWQVTACCRAPQQAQELHALAARHAGRIEVQALAVDDAVALADLPARLGALRHLDLLINNAGVLVSGERLGNVRSDDLARSFAINASAPLLLTQALAPLLEHAHAAKVLCISSQLGSIAQASTFRTVSYAMSKAALGMAARRLAAELGPRGITVLVMHPGWVRTDMGGASAPLLPQAAVTGMLAVLARATPAQGGHFYAYDGTELPW